MTQLLSSKDIFKIALPIMLSNVSTPLIGVVDTVIIGQTPDPSLIGAVAVSALIFTFVFWAFGFLRMGTTGLTAQAVGAENKDEIIASLGRSLLLASTIGVILIVLQQPIAHVAFSLLGASENVELSASEYFDIRIWSAPATLINYVILGWLIALGKSKQALLLQLTLNCSNMVLDALFVLALDYGVAGVAWGTLISEYFAAALGFSLVFRAQQTLGGRWDLSIILDRKKIRRNLTVNVDIMIRSLALILIFSWFTASGARMGDLTLAANAVLLHFMSVSAYFLDGIAVASEKFVGEAFGRRSREFFIRSCKLTTAWAVAVAATISIFLLLTGEDIVNFITVDEDVRAMAHEYVIFAALTPIIGVWCFQLDGIFIGATAADKMRNSMLLSTTLFFLTWFLLQSWGNLGLWIAFVCHFIYRALTLSFQFPSVSRSVESAA